MKPQSKPIHRAWLVFAGVCLYYFVAFGLLYSGFGLFLTPMSEDLSIPYVQLSATATVRVLSGMVTTALAAKIFPKVRLRRFLALVLLVLAGSLLLVSLSSRMWQFIPAFAIMGLCCGLTLYSIVPIVLNQWFSAPAPLITAASACGAAGGIVLCPALSQVIDAFGWRAGYRGMALLVLAVMLPVALFLMDYSPRVRSLTPFENKTRGSAQVSQSNLARSGALLPRSVLTLLCLFFLLAALSGGMYIHISSAMRSKGFTVLQVSLLVSAFQSGTALMQFIPGLFSAKLQLRSILSTVLPLTALGAVGLVFLTPDSPFPVVVLVVFLVGGSRMFTSINSLLVRYTVGQQGFTRLYSRLHAVFLVGTAFTSLIFGGIYSATGSYNASLWLIAGCMAALLLLTHLIMILVDRVPTQTGGLNHDQ